MHQALSSVPRLVTTARTGHGTPDSLLARSS